ncbi:MAG: sodium:solute symporter family transporter [Brevinemataceae bacterium]
MSYIDWGIVCVYLTGLFLLGSFFSKSNNSSEKYFVGGRNVFSWVAAFSMYATVLSVISYVSNVANVYNNGWFFGVAVLGDIVVVLLAAYFFVPFIRKWNYITAYEYLGNRFNKSMRMFASAMFILFHIIRIGIIIFIPAVIFMEIIPDIHPVFIILSIGFLSIIYTVAGGFSGVVWTDTIQAFILIAGAVLVIYYGFAAVPEGVNPFRVLYEDNKIFTPDELSFNFTRPTLWALWFGVIFNDLYAYIGSQDIVQRYNSTKTVKEAQRALLGQIPLLLTSIIMFLGMGSAIYLFYKYNPTLLPILKNSNAVMPYFAVYNLPIGISGLVISAVFAAAQSTISSSINSISACVVMDFLVLRKSDLSDHQKVKYARIVCFVAGFLSILVALYLLKYNQTNMFILFNTILGLMGGPIVAVFLLGMLTKVNTKSAWSGVIVSVLVALYIGNPAKILNLIPGYQQPKIFEFGLAFITITTCVGTALITNGCLLIKKKISDARSK